MASSAEAWNSYPYARSRKKRPNTSKKAQSTHNAAKNSNTKKRSLRLKSREKSLILLTILLAGICCVAVIFMQAYASDINYSVYQMNSEISEVEDEIDNLYGKINTGYTLDDVESYAIKELGMYYPTTDKYIYVKNIENTQDVDKYISELSATQRGVSIIPEVADAAEAGRILLSGTAD